VLAKGGGNYWGFGEDGDAKKKKKMFGILSGVISSITAWKWEESQGSLRKPGKGKSLRIVTVRREWGGGGGGGGVGGGVNLMGSRGGGLGRKRKRGGGGRLEVIGEKYFDKTMLENRRGRLLF